MISCRLKKVLEDSLTNFLNTGWYKVVSQVTWVNPHGWFNAGVTEAVVFSSTSGSSRAWARSLEPTAGKVDRTFPTPKDTPDKAFSFNMTFREIFFKAAKIFVVKTEKILVIGLEVLEWPIRIKNNICFWPRVNFFKANYQTLLYDTFMRNICNRKVCKIVLSRKVIFENLRIFFSRYIFFKPQTSSLFGFGFF